MYARGQLGTRLLLQVYVTGGGWVRMQTWIGREELAGRGLDYQFAATIGLLRMFRRFDFGLCFTFGIEDLFFFFCSSRPIV